MKDKEVTNSIKNMLNTNNINDIKLAAGIIAAQPDMIDKRIIKDQLEKHWYDIDKVIDKSKSVKWAELYMNDDTENKDKVYILNIQKSKGNNYCVEAHYGRRGKNMQYDNKGVFNEEKALKVYEKTLREKIKKGYTHLN